ncbi:MAG: hypothetical protein KKD18_01620 [Nanoarchaeota archaeon]|nr:hypothetical protein [Nanoarchaeota archaeon]
MGEIDGIKFNMNNPLWTKNIFVGPPPDGYISWSDWIGQSTKMGLFTGVKIEAIRNRNL